MIHLKSCKICGTEFVSTGAGYSHRYSYCSIKCHKRYIAFDQHIRRATRRGIPFLLTLKEWVKIWTDSGHFNERGIQRGQYVMGRHGDEGPYAVGNVSIITVEQNARDGMVGFKQSEEAKEAISKGLIGNQNSLGYKHPKKRRQQQSVTGLTYHQQRREAGLLCTNGSPYKKKP